MRHHLLPRMLLAAALLAAGPPAWPADPAPSSAGATRPVLAPSKGGVPKAAPTCANQAYQCPSSAQCKLLGPVPAAATAPYDAYQCLFAPVLDPADAGQCPTGLVATTIVPQTGAGQSAIASVVCAPASNACPQAHQQWVKVVPVLPFQPPLRGYTCRYRPA